MGFKRLIVACDGTWTDSDNGFVRDSWLPWKTGGKLANPSNVTRTSRALLPRSSDGIPQVVYYQAGVGSQNNAYSYFVGGYLGSGISENIREAYAYLCNNYEDGDEIVLLGFSRGAFTARSISALVAEVGLLTVKGLDSFYPIFKDWENQVDPAYQAQYGSIDRSIDRPSFKDPDYMPRLIREGMTRPNIPVKIVGVWDTVGTLGVPELDVAGFRLFSHERKEYSFVSTEVASNVEYAFQAFALDEERMTFSPTVWESPKPGSGARLKLLKQCWFPGVHSSIGGGYADSSVSNVTLAWMITQLQPFLSFHPDYIKDQQQANEKFYTLQNVPVCSWAMGQIEKSDTGALNAVTGRGPRTPGAYHAIDSNTGKPTDRLLTNTCEFIHPSVRYRIQQKGLGLATKDDSPGQGVYEPAALEGWTYVTPGQNLPDGVQVDAHKAEAWRGHGRWVKAGRGDSDAVFVVEERIEDGTTEMALVQAWPGVENHFMQHGWLKLSNCFSQAQADELIGTVWTRLGMSPTDKSTWHGERHNMPKHNEFEASEFAPKAWAAICDLLGGEERIGSYNRTWNDGLIVNLGTPEGEGKDIHGSELPGWHVDGDFFVHFLNSPEQGLLVIPLFTDINPGGGGTMICPSAIGPVAQHLHDHPEGVSPMMTPRAGNPTMEPEKVKRLQWFCDLAKSMPKDAFVEASGKVGDVYLLHPLMLHSASNNKLRELRIITNPPVSLNEPFDFDRRDESLYSVVERKTLKELGKERLPGWEITEPRMAVVPERLRRQAAMREEELKRLQDLKGHADRKVAEVAVN
ncbi:hypothetical protein LTS14_002373 [Recurvomyces mirabilis]|uniref:uncharacterized protein n=1 Tax=Recurvomyces mirabilis TaxID=574656 RepID=UPI002DE0CA8F|nr:hypothetical protein LTS14_002373 [Recurvomyces mirabilis]